MRRITVTYSENFRENRTPSEIYSRLRDNKLDPIKVVSEYNVGVGRGKIIYIFGDNIDLPSDSRLAEILKDIPFDMVGVFSI
jgi:hypothetical protein